MTVSTPVKIVALAGLAVALGLGGLMLLMSNHGSAAPPAAAAASVTHPAPTTRHVPTAHTLVHHSVVRHAPALHLNPALPTAVRAALMHHPVAVVAVYSSQIAIDRDVLTEARAGARAAHAGFVAANVAVEPIAAAVATWSSTITDPEVLIVRRPGTIVFSVSGPTDRDTVAQAAVTAK